MSKIKLHWLVPRNFAQNKLKQMQKGKRLFFSFLSPIVLTYNGVADNPLPRTAMQIKKTKPKI
jgi:hypothetical protein